nr:putative nuclease HARBI1 [Vanessa tameamea]
MDAAYNFIFENNVLENLDYLDTIVRRPRIFKERRSYFEEYDDLDFCTRFRLSKETTLDILQLIEDKLEYPSDRNESISPINQILLTLRYYATGSQQITVGDYCGISKSSSRSIIHRVTAAIASLSRNFIKFPNTEEEIRKTQLSFYNIARFPKAVGALDCTHIRIRSPGGENAEYFRNRKGYMSINVQAICDANLQILDLVARWPGSSQDQTIWNASYRNALFERGRYGDAILLADSGYMNRSYIMMPLDNPQTPEEILYNEAQIRSRNPIERLFGVWKRRFPVLALGMQIHLNKCLPVIVATGVLHNIAVKAKEDIPPDDPELELTVPWEEMFRQGHIREQRNTEGVRDINPERRMLINNYFKSLHISHNLH